MEMATVAFAEKFGKPNFNTRRDWFSKAEIVHWTPAAETEGQELCT
jgi:hypothetical protein